MTKLELYTGSDCTLCSVAKELIYTQLPQSSYYLEEIDINLNLETKKQYGLRIPLLRNSIDGAELPWPFDSEQLRQFVGCD